MKSLKYLYFVLGMTGIFSMAFAGQMEWLGALSATQASASAIVLALACAAALGWLTQFRRRHVGTPGLLYAFAACGLLVTALPPIETLALLPAGTEGAVSAVLRLTLFALFCLIAVRTQPVSEHVESTL
jgi:hypothetical protein